VTGTLVVQQASLRPSGLRCNAESRTNGLNTIESDELFDITIIGGGPTGQYAAYYSGLRGMRTKIIESCATLGGQVTALYPEKDIFDVPGFRKVAAKELVRNLTDQMMQYNPTLVLQEQVAHLCAGTVVRLTARSGKVHHSKSVLIACGLGAFTPRKMAAKGVAEFEGRGVFYHLEDPAALAGKRILIVGGGDSAFDYSMGLSPIAKSVMQIHRSDKFRAHEDTVRTVRSLPVDLRTFHELKEVHGVEKLVGVTIFDNRTGQESYHECDLVLLNLGFLSNLGPVKEWGLEITGNSIGVNQRMETNIPGVFAAGDIVDYPGKLKLIATGFAEAAIAVNHAKAYVDPTSRAFPGHSSEQSTTTATR
jgi:thioredoxin reductase (NADPH)